MKYTTPTAFRNALDARFRTQATASESLVRLGRRLAYERFLARLFSSASDAWVLKGGYALELRLGGRARATKDLDFNAPPGSEHPVATTQEAYTRLVEFLRGCFPRDQT